MLLGSNKVSARPLGIHQAQILLKTTARRPVRMSGAITILGEGREKGRGWQLMTRLRLFNEVCKGFVRPRRNERSGGMRSLEKSTTSSNPREEKRKGQN